MPILVATLFETNKVDHNLPKDSPLLNMPLALFKEEEYEELSTIIWLYGHALINPKKAPNPNMAMGQISKSDVTDFVKSVQQNITQLTSAAKSTELLSKHRWITPTLVTQYLATNRIYKILNLSWDCPKELGHLFSWLNKLPLTPEDIAAFAKHLQQLNSAKTRNNSIKKLAQVLMEIEPFKSSPCPVNLIYQCIITINKAMKDDLEEIYIETLGYFRDVLIELSQQYPPTLNALLLSLGVTVPNDLSPDLIRLLYTDLRKVPDLKPEQWPELIYYVLLFINQLAEEDAQCYYTYAGNELSASLNTQAQKYAKALKPFVETAEQCKEVINATVSTRLRLNLKAIFPTVHPKLLALICFENCPALKKLFVAIWNETGQQDTTHKSKALLPVSNQFVYGKTYNTTLSPEAIFISNHDLLILDELKRVAGVYKKTNSISFFPPNQNELREQYELDFAMLQAQIKNTALRQSLTLATIANYRPILIRNYDALTQFFITHREEALNPPPLTYKSLQDFFEIIPTLEQVDTIIKRLGTVAMLDSMNDIDSLNTGIANLQTIINTLNEKLNAPSPTTPEEEMKLRKRWFNVQIYIYTHSLTLTQNKLAQLQEEAVQSGLALEASRSNMAAMG